MANNTGTLYFKSIKAGEFELDNIPRFVESILPHLKLDRFEKMIAELTPAPPSENIAAPPPSVPSSELILAEEITSGVVVENLGNNKFTIVANIPMNADTAVINFDYHQYGIQTPSLQYFTVSAQCKTNATGKVSAASGFVELVDNRVFLTLFGKKNNSINAMVVIKFN